MARPGNAGSLFGKVVTVVGGSGFLGTHLAQELLARGARLRIASRNPRRAFRLKPLANLGQVQFVAVDVERPSSLGKAFAGCDAVVNLVGAFAGDLDAVQGAGAGRIAAAAKDAGATSFVHISAIVPDGLDAAYVRTKRAGEAAVEAAFPGVTIVRPSLMFGPDDNFTQMFARLIALFPALPVFAPDARLQPVFVDDVAEAIGAILADPDKQGRTYEFGGPEVITMLELNRLIATAQGRKRALIELPSEVSRLFAKATGWLPMAPITSDQLAMLEAGNVASTALPGLKEAGVTARPLGLFLDRWMTAFRKHGRFGTKISPIR